MARPKHYLNFISDLSANDPWLYKGTTSNLKVYNSNFRTLCQRTITEIASFVNICILIFFKISSSPRFICVCFRHQSPKHLPARRHKKKEKHNFDLKFKFKFFIDMKSNKGLSSATTQSTELYVYTCISLI